MKRIRSTRYARRHRLICWFLLFQTLFPPAFLQAANVPGGYATKNLPSVAADAVPQLQTAVTGISSVEAEAAGKLVIHQSESKAIADWKTFNIGKDAWVQFDQQGNTNWSALNRIYDANPSQIYGKLSADGNVFLINSNGILFGPDSRVDVHGLTASALNIAEEDFNNNILKFAAEKSDSEAYVSNHGSITTSELGRVFLIAPNVENFGTITTPSGQTGLVAGKNVTLYANEDSGSSRTALIAKVQTPGAAVNGETGKIITDTGLAGMYGKTITQNGLIRSVTAVKRNGSIELMATDRVTTGKNSITETPVSDSTETAHESFSIQKGAITIGGLDPDNPINPQTPVKQIEIGGTLSAPSGNITLTASDRVLIDSGATLNVAGEWAEVSPEDLLITAKLNSVELRDDYGQKNGDLKGATITVNPLDGSGIGDLSTKLASRQLTARQRSTEGGEIEIHSGGDIVIADGATVDISGGGTKVGAGAIGTTKLLVGNKIVDISDAEEWGSYKLLDTQQVISDRWGLVAEYHGLYTGGANPIFSGVSGYTEGSDAGTLKLVAPRIVMNGILNASVTIGDYQVLDEEEETAQGETKTLGLVRPKGGTLIIGEKGSGEPQDLSMVTTAVSISNTGVSLPDDFAIDDSLPDVPFSEGIGTNVSVISANALNSAKLDTIQIYADLGVRVEEGAAVLLNAGGYFVSESRSFSNAGSIEAPSGSIQITISDNKTSFSNKTGYVPLEDQVLLASGSCLSTAGETRDAAALIDTVGIAPTVQVDGGSITIIDGTVAGSRLDVEKNAVLDVSGGYAYDESGEATAGKGGTLSLESNRMTLAGSLLGLGAGTAGGGSLAIHTESILLSASGNTASEAPLSGNGIVLKDDFLEGSGFANVTLKSAYDLEVGTGVYLTPSYAKSEIPVLEGASGVSAALPQVPVGVSNATAETLEKSSITLEAGVPVISSQEWAADAAMMTVSPYSILEVMPGGSITVSGPGVKMAGNLSARAGDITVKADGLGDLTVYSTARLDASGYNLPDGSVLKNGEITYTPLSGGDITLSSAQNLTVKTGSIIDVSGSAPVYQAIAVDSRNITYGTVASDAGSVTLSAAGEMSLNGELRGGTALSDYAGGSLKLENRSVSHFLSVDSEILEAMVDSGFDYLTLAGYRGIEFTEAIDIAVDRKIVLDAPEIALSGAYRVRFDAPYVVLQNTYWDTGVTPTAGTGQLVLSGDWVDVIGSVAVSGAAQTVLAADSAVRFEDVLNTLNSVQSWDGTVSIAGDLVLSTPLTYVSTLSDVDIIATGQITISGTGKTGAPDVIASAGGNLSFQGRDVLIKDTIVAAPSGTISIKAADSGGRLQVADGAVLTTRGEDNVLYGEMDENNWYRYSKEDGKIQTTEAVTGVPEVGITLGGDDVVVENGGVIDVSGGGNIFTYQFLSGIQGTENPLTKSGRYVILPADPDCLPGDAVYLTGIDGVPTGYYTLLPEEYAFREGALVIEEVKASALAGGAALSTEGYPVVTGYEAYAGAYGHESEVKYYSVRSAADVLKEGYFNVGKAVTGNAGSLEVAGNTTLLQGEMLGYGLALTSAEKAAYQDFVDHGGILLGSLDGFSGAKFELSAVDIIIGTNVESNLGDIGFADAIPTSLSNKLVIDADVVAGSGIETLTLGKDGVTASVTVGEGTILDFSSISIYAGNAVTLEENASILSSEKGSLSIYAPNGALTLAVGASIGGQSAMDFTLGKINQGGTIDLTDTALTLTSGSMYFAGSGSDTAGMTGLVLGDGFWSTFGNTGSLTLNTETGLYTVGDVSVSSKNSITLNTPGLGVYGNAAGTVNFASNAILFRNTSMSAFVEKKTADGGTLALTAAGGIDLGKGNITLAAFDSTALSAGDTIRFMGDGSLNSSGNLTLTADRVITGLLVENGTYDTTDFAVTSGGNLIISAGDGSSSAAGNGGSLSLTAKAISQTGIVDVTGGRLAMAATGTTAGDGVTLGSTAKILARGTDYMTGGTVAISAKTGAVSIADGGLIDVSAGGQGDAGSITIAAAAGGVDVAGTLTGTANGGTGGAFHLETDSLSAPELTALNTVLVTGGFNHVIDLTSASGNIEIASGTAIVADTVRLAADGGAVSSSGTIQSDDAAGTIELYGQTGVSLNKESVITKAGSADGGSADILLSSRSGNVTLASGSTVGFTGATGQGGNLLYIRAAAAADGSDVNARVAGTVTGADAVTVEGVKVYENQPIINNTLLASIASNVSAFDSAATGIKTNVFGAGSTGGATLNVISGTEIRNPGNITVASGIDLSMISNSGAIAILAGGNLSINGKVDHHATSTDGTGWNITLVSGSDLTGADFTGTSSVGNMTMGSGAYIYSEKGSIRFASGGDMTVTGLGRTDDSTLAVASYSIATTSGDIRGTVAGNLILDGAALQSATGDIMLRVGGDLSLRKEKGVTGAIRTYGVNNTGDSKYSSYSGGGDILVDVGGKIDGVINGSAWDQVYTYSTKNAAGKTVKEKYLAASYADVLDMGTMITAGIATMGGGDVNISAGRDSYVAAGAFQEGDVTIHAGGNLDGRFLVSTGAGELTSGGSFGELTTSQVEMRDADLSIYAAGNLIAGAIVNPTLAASGIYSDNNDWNMTYGRNSSAHLATGYGDVVLEGQYPYYSHLTTDVIRARILPASLSIASGGDVLFQNTFIMAPSATGQLSITAAGDISGAYTSDGTLKHGAILMSDLDPEDVYGKHSGEVNSTGAEIDYLVTIADPLAHASYLLHKGDTAPVFIYAGGDISNVKFSLPKAAEITAAGDIRDIQYLGQNTSASDVTSIIAGGSIIFDPLATMAEDTLFSPGMENGGEGRFVVQAGYDIDLGKSNGIAMVGDKYNTALGNEAGELDVIAGFAGAFTPEELTASLNELMEKEAAYGQYIDSGDSDAADSALAEVHKLVDNIFSRYPKGDASAGDIDMVHSRIYSYSEGGILQIMASGEINVGRSTLNEDSTESTGIYTSSGAGISIHSGGDLNVNESKIMTYRGGDILAWSAHGDVNAGRGATTAISVDPPKWVDTDGDGIKDAYQFNPPAMGSGIRSLTYDPDGEEGPKIMPEAGSIYLFAPEGTIDAGEAGISGNRVILVATQVLNAQNIDFSAGSVGVPDTGGAAASFGAMAGAGAVSETGTTSDASGIADTQERFSKLVDELSDSLVPKWLAVEVIGFVEEANAQEGAPAAGTPGADTTNK